MSATPTFEIMMMDCVIALDPVQFSGKWTVLTGSDLSLGRINITHRHKPIPVKWLLTGAAVAQGGSLVLLAITRRGSIYLCAAASGLHHLLTVNHTKVSSITFGKAVPHKGSIQFTRLSEATKVRLIILRLSIVISRDCDSILDVPQLLV